MDYVERARDWATEILTERWTPDRFTLELEGEQVVMHRRLERQLYRATFHVWERVGAADVFLDARDTVQAVRYPLPGPDDDEPTCPPPTQPDATLEQASRAAVRAAAAECAHGILRASRVERRPDGCLRVHLQHLRPDGHLVVELDPQGAERVGFLCLPFLRGSTRSAALSRWTAVQRARAAVELPEDAWVAYSALRTKPTGREWTFRFELRDKPGQGWIKVTLNARSGALCGYARIVRERRPIDPSTLDAGEALRLLEATARTRLGLHARVGEPATSAVVRQGALVPAWLAVVEAGEAIYRATLAQGKVSLRKRGVRRGSA